MRFWRDTFKMLKQVIMSLWKKIGFCLILMLLGSCSILREHGSQVIRIDGNMVRVSYLSEEFLKREGAKTPPQGGTLQIMAKGKTPMAASFEDVKVRVLIGGKVRYSWTGEEDSPTPQVRYIKRVRYHNLRNIDLDFRVGNGFMVEVERKGKVENYLIKVNENLKKKR